MTGFEIEVQVPASLSKGDRNLMQVGLSVSSSSLITTCVLRGSLPAEAGERRFATYALLTFHQDSSRVAQTARAASYYRFRKEKHHGQTGSNQ